VAIEAEMKLQLPKHNRLTLEINDHLASYTTVAQEVEERRKNGWPDLGFADDRARERAIATNTLVVVRWSSGALGGSGCAAAGTIEEALALAIERGGAGEVVESAHDLPAAKASTTIEHNPHRHLYRRETERAVCIRHHPPPAEAGEVEVTLAEWIDLDYLEAGELFDIGDDPALHARILAADDVWTIQWYPSTPVGFNTAAGESFDAMLAGTR
jgi:hypothetical protein